MTEPLVPVQMNKKNTENGILISLDDLLCRGPTARFFKNRKLRRNSGSRD